MFRNGRKLTLNNELYIEAAKIYSEVTVDNEDKLHLSNTRKRNFDGINPEKIIMSLK